MGLINLNVYPRSTTGKNENRRTRAAGRTPAVVYGNKRDESQHLEFDTTELQTAMSKAAGKSALLSLTLDGTDEPFVAILREIQRHPVTDEIYHCDLFEIPLGVPLTLEVVLDFVGDNRLIKGNEAQLETIRRVLQIECLPRHLPDSVEVDYSDLTIGDKIVVGDIEIENAKILDDPEEIVLKLNAMTFEEEIVEEEEEGVEGEGEGAEGEGEDAEAGDESKEKPEDS